MTARMDRHGIAPRIEAVLRRAFALAATSLALFVVASCVVASGPVQAQALATSAAEAPGSWRAYGQVVQQTLRQWLSADDAAVRRFKSSVQERAKKGTVAPTTIASLWVSTAGKIERVEFEGLDEAASGRLRSLLAGRDLGLRPPPDMLQPLRLRLSLGEQT